MTEMVDPQYVKSNRVPEDISFLTGGTDRSTVALTALDEVIKASTSKEELVNLVVRLTALRDQAKSQLSSDHKTTEQTLKDLRSQGRVHGIDTIRGLGFDESRAEPEITEELIRLVEHAAVKSMLILDDGRSVDDYAKASSASSDWKMWINGKASKHSSGFITETHERLEWKVVPMEIADGPKTLNQSKSTALGNCRDYYTGHQIDLPDARLTVKAIRMHESATGEKLFEGVNTFTNLKNVVVGFANADLFHVCVISLLDVDIVGLPQVALAPASALRDQKS